MSYLLFCVFQIFGDPYDLTPLRRSRIVQVCLLPVGALQKYSYFWDSFDGGCRLQQWGGCSPSTPPSRLGLSLSRRRRSWSPNMRRCSCRRGSLPSVSTTSQSSWRQRYWRDHQQLAAHLSTVHVQTLVNCKLLLLVNNVNFNKIVLDMGGLSTSRWCTLMKDEPSP